VTQALAKLMGSLLAGRLNLPAEAAAATTDAAPSVQNGLGGSIQPETPGSPVKQH
jgi:hypothetical protein